MSYSSEFPDFDTLPAKVASLLTAGTLADLSWHHDACPSFVRTCDAAIVNRDGSADRVPVLWVNYADPAKRAEEGTQSRFLVAGPSFAATQGGNLETDNEAEAIARLLSYPQQSEDEASVAK